MGRAARSRDSFGPAHIHLRIKRQGKSGQIGSGPTVKGLAAGLVRGAEKKKLRIFQANVVGTVAAPPR